MTPYEDEANAEWAAERHRRRVEAFRAQRPIRLVDRGPIDPEVADWGKRLLAGAAGNLLLIGGVGIGKTWNAWEVLETAVRAGFAGRIMFASSARWRETIAPPVDRERLHLMRDADILVVDDLGSGRVGEWERECLLGIVDERWQHDRPTVITSNVESLRETLGERIASRLADGATVVVFEGDDRRRSR